MSNIRGPCIIAALVVIWTLPCAIPARAGTTGEIQGYATDTSFHPLAGVKVSAASPSGSIATTTSANGFYILNGLPLDTYVVAFTKSGYVPQSIAGIVTIQDQAVRVSAQLKAALPTIAHVTAHGATSLLQPTVTADTYVFDQSRLSDIGGTPQDLNGLQTFALLPGATGNSGTQPPTIHGGLQDEIGWQYDGIDNTNFLIPEPINYPASLNGVHSVQLSTGGYDVAEGNASTGVFNEVVKRGTYPAKGQATMLIMSPIFGHELSIEYGGATLDNRFSYFVSFGGQRDATGYGDLHTIGPLEVGNFSFQVLNDQVLNLFYHFGKGNSNELQLLNSITSYANLADYGVDPAIAPYASNNGNVQAASDPFGLRNFSTYQSSYTTLYPGQSTYAQNVGRIDAPRNNSLIQKINFKRQLTPSRFFELRLFRTSDAVVFDFPYNLGSFTDVYANARTTGLGEALDYTDHIGTKHELSFGAEGVYYENRCVNCGVTAGSSSIEPFVEPLEDLGCPQAANALGRAAVGGCYIAPFNAALDSRLGLGLPTDSRHAPMRTYVSDFSYSNDPAHRWDWYIKDRFQPSDRLTMTVGLRWDKASISLPRDAAAQNESYYIDRNGNLVTVAGQPIGQDVTQPSQISPRLAMSYQMGTRDAVRFSYGRNIQFVPFSLIEGAYQIPGALQNCNIASGCFRPLPGYGITNHVANLYQQILLDLNTKFFAQYTPLLPPTAVNCDFSYEHDFGKGVSLRVTPYYRRGHNYTVTNRQMLFTLPSGAPVFGPPRNFSAGMNENTGVEVALQRNAQFGFSGLLDATYDNTLANYDFGFFATNNPAALAAQHFFHVTYTPPVQGAVNLSYNSRSGLHASTTVAYECCYRYGVGKKTFVFAPNGAPVQVPNTDLASGSGAEGAYYVTNPSNPGTVFAPNIVASRGTPEGEDPGTLFGPAIITVNLTLSQQFGKQPDTLEIGVRAENLFANYAPAEIFPNPYYGFGGFGNNGLPSGVNTNACAPGQTYACEPFRYNFSPLPYEKELSGPPRVYTFFVSMKF